MKLVFVGGIHGVGKTTFCQHVANKCGLTHLTASELIKERLPSAISKGRKSVKNLDENQKALVEAITACRANNDAIILDGHFTLLVGSNIEPVPLTVFSKINPKLIVVLTAKPKTIYERLYARDGARIPLHSIQQHQEEELRHASVVANDLGIPILTVDVEEDSADPAILRISAILAG